MKDWVCQTPAWKRITLIISTDLQHNLFLLTLDDKLGLAPPNEPDSKAKHILDIGTGTGIWAIDYADEHPEAQVVGVDLSPIQPALYDLTPLFSS